MSVTNWYREKHFLPKKQLTVGYVSAVVYHHTSELEAKTSLIIARLTRSGENVMVFKENTLQCLEFQLQSP